MFAFTRLSLARQFLLASGLILLAGMLVIGAWVGHQIQHGVANRTAAVTALYVDSFVTPHLQDLARSDQLDAPHLAALDALLTDTPLGQRIVAFKVWGPAGDVLYSPTPPLIGRRFAHSPGLARAFAGEVTTEISNLDEPENEFERGRWPRLIETYAPVRLDGTSSILAVAEFYQTTDELDWEVGRAQLASWLVVGLATVAMYGLLAGLVGRASNMILDQHGKLNAHVAQLTDLLAQNTDLHERVRRAAARTTALNERFLRRISADLHDGLGQDLSLALLRLGALAEACAGCPGAQVQGRTVTEDFATVRAALEAALADVRSVSAGLRLPEIEPLPLAEAAERAVWDHERKTGRSVALSLVHVPGEAPLPVKITLYRLLQEALANGYRHAVGATQAVRVIGQGDHVLLEVADDGPGFEPEAVPGNGHLGLAGMRERVTMLGGAFEVESAAGHGTLVRVRLPLRPTGADDD